MGVFSVLGTPMQRCEFCGSNLPVNAQFCSNCGHPQFSDHKNDENVAVLPDLLLPGMLAMQEQMPSSAQAPMIQGTPQVGGVPSVHGTPAVPGNAPPSVPGLAHGAGSPAPAQAPGWEAQHRPDSPPHHYQAVHHPQPTSPLHELEHQHHHRHHTGPLRDHRPRTSRLHRSAAATSKTGMHVASKWLIVALTAIVVIGASGIILVHALMPAIPPGLTITGTSVVRDGGILHLHGQGFQPGDSITLTIDNGLPISLAGQHETQDISQGTQRSANVTGLSQMFIAGALQPRSVAATNITVSSSGTFDLNVTVPLSLLAGNHTIHAVDNQGSQSASMQFTVLSSELAVNPTALNFGSVEAGRTVQLSVTASNQGGTRLHWTASVDGSNTNWLTLPNSTGVIETNGSSEAIIVTANTNGLSLGLHSATLRIHSDNGDVQIAVKLNVIPIAQSGQQAILNVPQQNLDFGQLQTGQQVQQSISIANLGNLPLKWQASSNTASAAWLSLATSNGTVQTGAAPQTVQVKVNTTGLAAGSYSGTINITSNGGNATVTVTFGVTAVTPTPAKLMVNPTNLNFGTLNGGGSTGVLPVQVGNIGGQALTWNADTSGTKWLRLDISSSTIPPSIPPQTVNVTADTAGLAPGNYTAIVNFTSNGGSALVSIALTVRSQCPLTTSTSLNFGTLTQGNSSTLRLVISNGCTQPVNWTADTGGTNWLSLDTSSGTVPQGGQNTINVTANTANLQPGNYSAILNFAFNGGNTRAQVAVSLVVAPPPQITVMPGKIDPTSNSCTKNRDGTYNCTVTVGETSPGNLKWNAPTGIAGTNVSFKPPSGQLTTSQPQQPVTISSIPCSSASFMFTDQNNKTATVTWSCTPPTQTPPPLTLTVTPAG